MKPALAFASWLAIVAVGGITAASAQTRQDKAARVIEKHDAPSAACALLTTEEFAQITGRRMYSKPQGTQLKNGGSDCEYMSGAVTLFSGPQSEQHYESLLKVFDMNQSPKQPVPGLGERAFLIYLTTPDKHRGQHAVLVVRKGPHTMAARLQAEGNETPQSLQPKLMTMAKAAAARLP